MIFRKFINSEEVSFCNVDTPDEALELMIDKYATDYDDIMEHLQETIYGWQAALGRKDNGEPGDFIEIKAFGGADADVPAEIRKVEPPWDELKKAYPDLFPAGDGKKGKKKRITEKELLDSSGLRGREVPSRKGGEDVTRRGEKRGIEMKCPKCKEHDLEIIDVNISFDRKCVRIWVSCGDNCCDFSKILHLALDDMVRIARDPEAGFNSHPIK